MTPNYEVNLYLNGQLIGDVRELAQDFKWVRRRTKVGADEIDFRLNDVLFEEWCEERGTDINDLLKPMALECRVVRNGASIVGGFLATMPAYQPRGTSADLQMRFDGFLNLLGGVYIYNSSTKLPVGTVSGRMEVLVNNYITMANTRSTAGGKGYGLVYNEGSTMASVTNTFDNYKTVKEFICDRSDNTEGAGPFDVIFYADKTYDIWAQGEYGDTITDWVARYPGNIDYPSALNISADEVSGYASSIIALGSGEVSSSQDENTAIIAFTSNQAKTTEYGYYETLIQESSITRQDTLNQKAATELAVNSKIIWEPKISLSGRMIAPVPTGSNKIWLCDIITIENTEDLTGMTNGQFRVNELSVSVSANGAETISPVLERI